MARTTWESIGSLHLDPNFHVIYSRPYRAQKQERVRALWRHRDTPTEDEVEQTCVQFDSRWKRYHTASLGYCTEQVPQIRFTEVQKICKPPQCPAHLELFLASCVWSNTPLHGSVNFGRNFVFSNSVKRDKIVTSEVCVCGNIPDHLTLSFHTFHNRSHKYFLPRSVLSIYWLFSISRLTSLLHTVGISFAQS